jgi:hypothetical protein
MYVEGDLPVMTYGNCNNNNNGWNDWSWIIGLAVVGGIFGNGGFGFGGGRGFYGSPATQADLANGFAQNTLQRGIDDIILGQAQQTNFTNQGFAGLNTAIATSTAALQSTLCQGFNGVDRAIADTNANLANSICTLGYQQQSGFNALANQIASCCCDLKTMNLENRYLNEKQTCDIVSAINAGNQRLVDIYTADKMAAKDARIAALESKISNAEQSAYLLGELKQCPKAAYIVPNPNCCYNYGVYPTGSCGASVQ